MKILLVGALSWNPERILSLCERGHRLWGLWSRSMAWDQGPYPAIEHCVRPIALNDVSKTIRENQVDCVYSLFQVYHPKLWGARTAGVEDDVWTLLRALLLERQRGAFDVPFVRHWGFDVHNLDLDVVRALDGHLFCNREKLEYWSTPVRAGGCGLDVLGDCGTVEFLDSDRPRLEFMNDRFAERLSERGGEIHTVCIGRPFNIDYVAAARRGIHIHIYSNSFNDVYQTVARDLSRKEALRNADLLGRYLHLHPSLQTIGASWPEVRRTKSRWVEEFSQYDAGWSYIGSPLPWAPLDDRGAIPNRTSTYLLAGLPIITDRRPGSYRYEELRRLDVDIELVDSDYDDLRARLETEIQTREKRQSALEQRSDYSFEATIEPLLSTLERARASYFARPHAERSQFVTKRRGRPVYLNTSRTPRAVTAGFVRRLAPRGELSGRQRLAALFREAWEHRHRPLLPWKAKRLGRILR